MKNWIVYGTTATGIEDNFIVSANTKAEVLEYMEEAFGDFFHVEHIVIEARDGRVPLDDLFEEYEVHLRDLI